MIGSAVVWTASQGAEHPPESLRRILSAEEQRRLDAISAPGPAARFLFRRAARRILLARHLFSTPDALVFEEAEDGRPSLAAPFERWDFSATEAGRSIAIAAAKGVRIGIDAEMMNRNVNIDALAPKLLTESERAHWDERSPIDILALWCAKEAVIKALGGGLTIDRLKTYGVGPADASGWRPVHPQPRSGTVKIMQNVDGLMLALATPSPLNVQVVDATPLLNAAGLSARPTSISH